MLLSLVSSQNIMYLVASLKIYALLCVFLPDTTTSSYVEPISFAFSKLLQETNSEFRFSDAEDFEGLVQRQRFKGFDEIDQVRRYDSYNSNVRDELGNPEVQIKNGIVVGTTFPEAHAFYSIPFGKPPMGEKRQVLLKCLYDCFYFFRGGQKFK